jgi:ubiquitin-like 1-activating enzyme E1 A
VSPLLACVRALWQFEAQRGPGAAAVLRGSAAEDVRAFAALATRAHAALGLPPDSLKAGFVSRFLQNVGVEMGPAAAMLGGLLAQDAINVIGGRQQPVQNLCLFDGEAYQVPVYALHPPELYEEQQQQQQEANGNGVTADGEAVVILL